MANRNPNMPANGEVTHRIDSIKDSVKGLIDQGQHKATQIKDKVVDLQHKAKDRGTVAVDKFSEVIKAHPFAAIGIAFGVGYLAMRLVRR
jgi:ElaB/YqjD/DUF883 family membrane-anchored ribosome-binding protein